MNEKLVNEAIAGSKEAFCSLYGQYKDKLYRYALYKLRDPDDAEDAVSECVLAAWKSIPPESPVNLKTYLGKLTRETAIDRLRKRCARRRIPAGMIASLDELEEVVGENDVESGGIFFRVQMTGAADLNVLAKVIAELVR